MSVSYIPWQEPKRPGGLDEANGTPRGESWPSPPDPGDLSKRVARRRAELHLSKAQVAARAGMSLRYLEYVERYPARPGGTALRRLAAALQTTPAALLGAKAQAPPAYGRMDRPPVITKLMPAECRRLMAAGGIGRIAFEVDHIDEALSQGWSVLVRGRAHGVTHPAELEIVRRDAAIWPWPGGDRDVYVRIIPATISGRRIESR